jgi:hypothetical protein
VWVSAVRRLLAQAGALPHWLPCPSGAALALVAAGGQAGLPVPRGYLPKSSKAMFSGSTPRASSVLKHRVVVCDRSACCDWSNPESRFWASAAPPASNLAAPRLLGWFVFGVSRPDPLQDGPVSIKLSISVLDLTRPRTSVPAPRLSTGKAVAGALPQRSTRCPGARTEGHNAPPGAP